MTSRRVVVVGAGILGASVTARLAAACLPVTLLDQDRPGRATSRWSFAWINSNDKGPRPYHDLNHAGMRAWAELAPHLDGDAWYRPSGHVELAVSRAELEARVQRLTDWGYPARLIDVAEAAALEPALRVPPDSTAAFFPDEGYILTEPLIARLVAYAESRGADVRTGEPGRVTGLDTSPDASPRVRTAAGAALEADEVVCCAGRWTPDLAAVPLVPWRTRGSAAPGLVVRVGPVAPPGPVRLVHTPDLALRPHPGSLLHLEAEDAAAAVDLHTPEPELRRWGDELLHRARRTVRGLDDARVVELKVCARPLPLDGQSIVGRLPGVQGIYVAVTHSGVTLAAHLSRLITADLTTKTPPAELTPYTPARLISDLRSGWPHSLTTRCRLAMCSQVGRRTDAEYITGHSSTSSHIFPFSPVDRGRAASHGRPRRAAETDIRHIRRISTGS